MNLQGIRKLLKAIIGTPRGVLKQGIEGIHEYHSRSVCSKGENTIESVCYQLRILTHVIEKALSLPIVKKGFGTEKIKSLVQCLDQYLAIDDHDYDPQAYDYAVSALRTYVENATTNECDVSFVDLGKYTAHAKMYVQSGVEWFEPDIYAKYKQMDFREFAEKRHSIRSFAEVHVSNEMIKDAVILSQTAPSACNRQSARVIHVTDMELCRRILEMQGGAKGHSITEVLLIASDLNLYRYCSERNTPYIDGGIFTMNLIYALTYYGIGTCPLIWDDYGEKGERIRKLVKIPENLHIVAVLQIGLPSEGCCKHAVSSRRPIDDVYFTESHLLS